MIGDILHDGMKKGIFREVDANSLASIIIGSMDGIMLQWIINKNAVDLDKVGDVMVDSLLNGIKK